MKRVTEEAGMVRFHPKFGKLGGKRIMDVDVGLLVAISRDPKTWDKTRKEVEDWLKFLQRYPDLVMSPLWDKQYLETVWSLEDGYFWPMKEGTAYRWRMKRLGDLDDQTVYWLVTEFDWGIDRVYGPMTEKAEAAYEKRCRFRGVYKYFAELEYKRRAKRGCYDELPVADDPLQRVKGFQAHWFERSVEESKGIFRKPSGWGVKNPCDIGDLIGVFLGERRLVHFKFRPMIPDTWIELMEDGKYRRVGWRTVKVLQREPRKDRALQERKRVYSTVPIVKGDPWPMHMMTEEEVISDKVIELWDEIWRANLDGLQELNDKVSWMVEHKKICFTVEAMLRDEIEKRMEIVLNEVEWEWKAENKKVNPRLTHSPKGIRRRTKKV